MSIELFFMIFFNYLKVALKDEPKSIGALVTVETAAGRKLYGHFITSEGLCSDSSHVLSFGLGAENAVKKVTIKYLSGGVETIDNPKVDSTLSCQGPPPPAPPPAAAPVEPAKPEPEAPKAPAKGHKKGGGK